jgi:hypothetical protein
MSSETRREARIYADGTLFPDAHLVVWWNLDDYVHAADWSGYGVHVMTGMAARHGQPDEELSASEFLGRLPDDTAVKWLGAGYTPSGAFGGDFARGRDSFTAGELLDDITTTPAYPSAAGRTATTQPATIPPG